MTDNSIENCIIIRQASLRFDSHAEQNPFILVNFTYNRLHIKYGTVRVRLLIVYHRKYVQSDAMTIVIQKDVWFGHKEGGDGLLNIYRGQI